MTRFPPRAFSEANAEGKATGFVGKRQEEQRSAGGEPRCIFLTWGASVLQREGEGAFFFRPRETAPPPRRKGSVPVHIRRDDLPAPQCVSTQSFFQPHGVSLTPLAHFPLILIIPNPTPQVFGAIQNSCSFLSIFFVFRHNRPNKYSMLVKHIFAF